MLGVVAYPICNLQSPYFIYNTQNWNKYGPAEDKTDRQLLSVHFAPEEEAAKCNGAWWWQHWGQRTLTTVGGGEEMSSGHVHC